MTNSLDTAKCKLVADALRSGQQVKIRALGVSMMPAIWPGDVLIVEPAAVESLRVGEIVVFERYGRIFAHRLISRGEYPEGEVALTVRGDRMNTPDPEVSGNEYLGRVVRLERAGRVVRIARRPGVGQRIAAQLTRWDRGLAAYLGVARLLGRTDYPASGAAEAMVPGNGWQ